MYQVFLHSIELHRYLLIENEINYVNYTAEDM